jgi:hypothetical protein
MRIGQLNLIRIFNFNMANDLTSVNLILSTSGTWLHKALISAIVAKLYYALKTTYQIL